MSQEPSPLSEEDLKIEAQLLGMGIVSLDGVPREHAVEVGRELAEMSRRYMEFAIEAGLV
jgi:hypothetical protein